MLERLTLRDLVLIERADIEFGPGLNVVTGETGAGKSLLVLAVNLLIGERADADIVREGAKAAIAEGEFRVSAARVAGVRALLDEWGTEFDGDTLIVRREVTAAGRSRAVVNDRVVTLAALRRLGELLVDLHGQHEHQSLLRADAGLETLDGLGGLSEPRARYVEALAELRAAEIDLDRLEESLRTWEDRRGWMMDAAAELDAAQLVDGEDERLRDDAARLAHADRLRERVTHALAKLSDADDAAVPSMTAAAHALEQAAAIDSSLANVLAPLEEARIAAGEAARALAEYLDALEADPAALEQIEARRELLARLARKHRRPVAGLIAWREELADELTLGESGSEALDAARARVTAARSATRAAGRALTRARQAAAREFGTRITRELRPLGFQHAKLEFAVESSGGAESEFLAHGLDRVEILFAANPGEPARPLRKIASGGELSRVMLALKSALQTQDCVDVLLFDEVDSGIGGAVAQAVGERLQGLARHRHVLCVTHLPMIAALAARHLRIRKHVVHQRTLATVETLDGDDRIEEIARMLAGSRTTDTTRRQARELLDEAPEQGAAR